ncbi:glycosyl transferase [Rhizobium helianthi]|uniref:Glycosyl transferase n=1 Tax=Rhizobium helianthi TaxID=1132695 RepID=A0ABW4M2Z6_9HYPH
MLTVLMECRDQESELAQTLSVLVAGAVEGLVSDVVILDKGSKDGSARVADAAGCRFLQDWDLPDVLKTLRGEWVLLIEPGARPQMGWIDELAEHMAHSRQPIRFSLSRNYRRPLLARFLHRRGPLEMGLVLPASLALSKAKPAAGLTDLAAGLKPFRLASEMVPSWAASRA